MTASRATSAHGRLNGPPRAIAVHVCSNRFGRCCPFRAFISLHVNMDGCQACRRGTAVVIVWHPGPDRLVSGRYRAA